MKKTFKLISLVLAVIIAITLLLVGCDKDKKDDTKNSEKTEFIIGLDPEFKPYGFKNDKGEIVGFDIDLAKEVCKRNKWKFVAQPINWKSKKLEVDSGTIDCVWNGFTITDELKDKFTWTKPYVDSKQVVVVKKDSGIKKLKDLKDKIIVVQAASSAESTLIKPEVKEFADSLKKIDKVKDYTGAFMNLEAGSVQAIGIDYGTAKSEIEKRGDKFVILDEVLAQEQYGIGFKKGNTELRDKVEKTLDEMKKDGTFMKLAKNWDLQNDVIVD